MIGPFKRVHDPAVRIAVVRPRALIVHDAAKIGTPRHGRTRAIICNVLILWISVRDRSAWGQSATLLNMSPLRIIFLRRDIPPPRSNVSLTQYLATPADFPQVPLSFVNQARF